MRVGRKENMLVGCYGAGVLHGEEDNEKSNLSGVGGRGPEERFG